MLYAVDEWLSANVGLLEMIPEDQVTPLRESQLERISFLQTPNQVLGVFKKPVFEKTTVTDSITLLLDEIQDPGNLGTIIRTADWFSIKNIICGRNSADVFNPKVVQSTMGSIARVEVTYADLKTFLDDHAGTRVYAATMQGENIFNAEKMDRGFILIGNESRGIRPELITSSVKQITIPKLGKSQSLNVAVAAGIVISILAAGK